MVRFKKRYFVVQLDREKDLTKPRAFQDSKHLERESLNTFKRVECVFQVSTADFLAINNGTRLKKGLRSTFFSQFL